MIIEDIFVLWWLTVCLGLVPIRPDIRCQLRNAFLRLSSLYFISTLSAIKAARKNHIFCIFFLLIPCRERIQSVNRPFALVDHVLTQILLIFGGRCNHYFWDMRLRIHRLLNFNMLFQFLLTKFSKSKVFSCLQRVDHVTNYCQRPNARLKSECFQRVILNSKDPQHWTPLGPSLL